MYMTYAPRARWGPRPPADVRNSVRFYSSRGFYQTCDVDCIGEEELQAAMQSGDAVLSGTMRDRVCRSCRGTHQGCVLATLGACLPMHLRLHALNKLYPWLEILCDADDTYYKGHGRALYDAFDVIRGDLLANCDLRSNLDKVKALVAGGGVRDIPEDILTAQGGELFALKVVGAFVGANTAAGVQARKDMLRDKLSTRIHSVLDEIDAMHDTEGETDNKQLQYQALRRSINKIPIYWGQTMPPSITEPVMAQIVDARMRTTLSLIAAADASSAGQQDDWWLQSQMPTTMGGLEVGGHAMCCGAYYSSSVLACWPELSRTCATLIGVSIQDSELPMLAACRGHYESLCAQRDRIDAIYAEYSGHVYTTIRGEKLEGHFRPSRLPARRHRSPWIPCVLSSH